MSNRSKLAIFCVIMTAWFTALFAYNAGPGRTAMRRQLADMQDSNRATWNAYMRNDMSSPCIPGATRVDDKGKSWLCVRLDNVQVTGR